MGTPTVTPFSLDGKNLYVKAEATLSANGQYIVSGFPTYVFESLEGTPEGVTDSFFRVSVELDGGISTIPLPIRQPIGDPLLVKRPDGNVFSVFTELDSGPSEPFPNTVGLWSGIWDGRVWSELTHLPIPSEYSISDVRLGKSALVQVGGEVWFAVRVEPRRRLLLFKHENNRWAMFEPSSRDKSWPYLSVSWVTAVRGTGDDWAFVTVQSNVRRGGHGISLKLLRPAEEEIKEVELFTWYDGLTTSGIQARIVGDTVTVLVGEEPPTVHMGLKEGDTRNFSLPPDSSVSDSHLVLFPDRSMAVLAQPRFLDGTEGSLAVHGLSSAGLGMVQQVRSDLLVLQSAAVVEEELVLAGLAGSTEPFVTSLVRFPIECAPRGTN